MLKLIHVVLIGVDCQCGGVITSVIMNIQFEGTVALCVVRGHHGLH